MTPRTLLHVGCGPKRKDQTTRGFATDAWRELRLDIDASVAPDLIGTMTKQRDTHLFHVTPHSDASPKNPSPSLTSPTSLPTLPA